MKTTLIALVTGWAILTGVAADKQVPASTDTKIAVTSFKDVAGLKLAKNEAPPEPRFTVQGVSGTGTNNVTNTPIGAPKMTLTPAESAAEKWQRLHLVKSYRVETKFFPTQEFNWRREAKGQRPDLLTIIRVEF